MSVDIRDSLNALSASAGKKTGPPADSGEFEAASGEQHTGGRAARAVDKQPAEQPRATSGPLVSIITPCLDAAPRLARCLDSVASQTYARVEHIVVDGGSSDGTPELLGSRATVRWISEPDDGQASALNKGFALARGELIGWLNADDVLGRDAVALGVEALASEPKAGWVHGDIEVWERGGTRWRCTAGPSFGLDGFMRGNPINQPGTLITRDALAQVGYIDDAFELSMDFDLWLRLVDAGYPGLYLPCLLASFELHEASKTGTTPNAFFVREQALAIWRSGRRRRAEARLGQSAAAAAAVEGRRTVAGVRAATREAGEWAAGRGMDVRRRRVAGWGFLAAWRAESFGPRHLALLLQPELVFVAFVHGIRARLMRSARH